MYVILEIRFRFSYVYLKYNGSNTLTYKLSLLD